MLLPSFQYHEPKNLNEAIGLLGEMGGGASILAGGTDLLVNMKKGKLSPKNIVCLSRVEELKGVKRNHGSMSIGPCVTAADLKDREEVKSDFSALAEGAGLLGSPLIRNLATIGGNIVTARPAADLAPPLMVYGARVVLKKTEGERILPLEEFFLGPGQTSLETGEILCSIVLDSPPSFSGGGYVKLGLRKSLEISLVNVAAFLSLDGPSGPVRDARIVLGAVAPKPMRSSSAEETLIGGEPDERLFQIAAEKAAGDARPIDDFRGSAEYRREMVKVLTKKALVKAYEEAKLREWRRWK
ncbi:MAG: xanthine dehydrogenase family protein subunit M [Deltaproteobacteria bacterium HGW-Deltaproteobacteria-21]|nr:MAG: xanthine dehydrogenase family protein subunit M [Deltaproteobacteria bacterium HGW-Deltaproteobacteria-21]